jgi:hypothetical protein
LSLWRFCNTTTDREIIERIESLAVEEQDNLFELIRKRRSPQSEGFANEQQRTEIAEVGERLRQVYALPDDFMRDEVIIGRNILNRYVIHLDDRNGVFTIS